ncbi:MAG: hypothetical protein ABEJ58_09855 [Halodesulfurarchaeum sp.]
MSSTTHRSAGDRVEDLAADRLDAEVVPDHEAYWFDLETASGEPVDVKGCRRRIKDGHRYGEQQYRAGRFWIPREYHERLVENDGYYALIVYEEQSGDIEVVRFALLPAAFLEPYIGEWSTTGDRTRHSADEAAKIRHTSVFPGLEEGDS